MKIMKDGIRRNAEDGTVVTAEGGSEGL